MTDGPDDFGLLGCLDVLGVVGFEGFDVIGFEEGLLGIETFGAELAHWLWEVIGFCQIDWRKLEE